MWVGEISRYRSREWTGRGETTRFEVLHWIRYTALSGGDEYDKIGRHDTTPQSVTPPERRLDPGPLVGCPAGDGAAAHCVDGGVALVVCSPRANPTRNLPWCIVCILPCSSAGTAIRQARLRAVYGVFQVSVGWGRPGVLHGMSAQHCGCGLHPTRCLNRSLVSRREQPSLRGQGTRPGGRLSTVGLAPHANTTQSSTASSSPAMQLTTPSGISSQTRLELLPGGSTTTPHTVAADELMSCHVMSGAPARIQRRMDLVASKKVSQDQDRLQSCRPVDHNTPS